MFKIEKTERLQDGIERIMFSAGESALRHITRDYETLHKTSRILNTNPEQLPIVAKALVEERDRSARELKKLRQRAVESKVRQLTRKAKVVGPVRLSIVRTTPRTGEEPIDLANRLKESDPALVAVLFHVSDKVQIVVAAGDDAVKSGVNAAEVVSEAAKTIGGKGGGRAYFATGGGPHKDMVTAASNKVEEIVVSQVSRSTPQAERVA